MMNDIFHSSQAIIVMLLLSSSLFFMQSVDADEPLDGKTLYVGGSGPGNYSKINHAIRAASNGDIIFVYNGIYSEELYVDKSVRIIGENKYNTIVNGGGEGDCVLVVKRDVSLFNLTLRNGGRGHNYSDDAAIEVLADGVRIEDVVCMQVNYGVWVRDAENVSIENCTINCLYDGIWLFKSKNCIIRNNSLSGASIVLDGNVLGHFIHEIDVSNTVNGKPVYYYKNQSGITVPSDAGQVILANCGNFIIENLDISHVTDCVELFFSNGNTIKNNFFHDTVDFGVRLVQSHRNSIVDNKFVNNPIAIGFMSGGVWIEDMGGHCYGNKVSRNLIKDSWYQGIRLHNVYYNKFSKNDFVHNGWNSEKGAHVFFVDSFENEWYENFYDDWIGLKRTCFREFPKLIVGSRHMFWTFPDKATMWLAFDWNPAIRPNTFS